MDTQKKGLGKKIALLMGTIGPGLFLIGYNIGTGSITTMASAGSRYGMSLFWTLLLSCLFTYVMMIAYGHYTAVTGETAMNAYKKHLRFGKTLAIYTMISLIIGELTALAGIMGILTDLIGEWCLFTLGIQVSTLWTAIVIIIGCFLLLWDGKYSHFEIFLTVLVIMMGLGFLGSMILVVPKPAELLAGLKPQIPNDPNAFLIVAGMAGTTCSAMVFIMRSIVVSEKGWKRDEIKKEKVDAFFSSFMMMLLSASVMACAAGTLFKMGKPVEQTIDMVQTLEPLAGRFAISIFVLGVIGAAVSTLFPIVLVAPWLIDDYRGKPRVIRSPMYRVLGGLGLMLGLVVPVFGGRPVWVMVASQAFQAMILPVITLPIIYLLNRRDLMGQDKAGFWMNLGLWATFIFAMITAYTGLVGLVDMLG
ncbi:Nramp family divalent metal transporter [bacterium]|nr:Nramp family divalent metal transporter [bacterium]